MKNKDIRRLEDMNSILACRGCLSLTNRVYRVGKTNVIACCPECAREAVECILDKRPWVIPTKIQQKMTKEQLEAIERFWFPIERAVYPEMISRGLIEVRPK